jgi:immune inhibitor A
LQEAFVIIHAGKGAETMDPNDPQAPHNIWSHKFTFPNGVYAADGATIAIYNTVPEDCRLGVCVHELAHQIFGW